MKIALNHCVVLDDKCHMRLNPAAEARRSLLVNAPPNTWIALSSDETRIVAQGATFEEATRAAAAAEEEDPIIVLVPEAWKNRVF